MFTAQGSPSPAQAERVAGEVGVTLGVGGLVAVAGVGNNVVTRSDGLAILDGHDDGRTPTGCKRSFCKELQSNLSN